MSRKTLIEAPWWGGNQQQRNDVVRSKSSLGGHVVSNTGVSKKVSQLARKHKILKRITMSAENT